DHLRVQHPWRDADAAAGDLHVDPGARRRRGGLASVDHRGVALARGARRGRMAGAAPARRRRVIEVDLSQRLGEFRLDVAFRAEAPVVGLFGRSGSGKTSLVNALAGISHPERGQVVVNGATLFDSERGIDLSPERRRLGYVL